ncbi:MAG: SapC family protein [Luminiphilus sp.]|nr:SapC family protein [Luminiphilus sp.]
MGNIQKLNNVEHAQLKIKQSACDADHVMFSPIYTTEMRALQSNFPLMFYKSPNDGSFAPVALFGFEQGENLFINENRWTSQYIPMLIQRGPLMIATEGQTATGETSRVIAIDMDHPNVSDIEGEPLFLEFGGNTAYLDRLAAMLEGIHQGHTLTPSFVDALNQHNLITAITLKITLNNGQEHALEGFYAIDDETLQTLNEEATTDLHRRGHLLPAYMMVASQSQLKRLIELKNVKVTT